MRRLLVAVLAALAAMPAAALAADPPPGAEWHEEYFTNPADGVKLHADVLRPKGIPADRPTPVIMTVSPYLGQSGQTPTDFDPKQSGPSDRFFDFMNLGNVFARGYTWVYVDLRGFGGSGGCSDWGGPGEQSDVKAAVEWAGGQKWSTGSVGLYGKSYDGWTGIMGLATRPKHLAAVLTQEPVIDGYRYVYMNGVHYSATVASAQNFAAGDAKPGFTPSSSPDYITNQLLGVNPSCWGPNVGQEAVPDASIDFWAQRNLIPKAKGATIPTFLFYGFLDDNTKPDHVFEVWNGLTGPKRAWFGQWDHVRGTDGGLEKPVTGHKGFVDEAMRFFDRYLKGDAPAADPAVEVQTIDGSWRAEEAWPPADSAQFAMPLGAGSYADDGGESAAWTFTQPLPYDVHLAGVPQLTVHLTTQAPDANLIAKLYDVAPTGKATLITRGGALVSGKAAFEVYGQDWLVAGGHRLGVQLTSADPDWFQTANTGQTVTVAGGALALPALAFRRTSDLQGKRSDRLSAGVTTIDVDPALIAKSTKPTSFPPAMVAAAAPPAPAAQTGTPVATPRLTLSLKRAAKRRLVVSGRCTARTKVRLLIGRRTAASRTVACRGGRFRVVFKVRRRGTYRAIATAAGQRAASRLVRVR